MENEILYYSEITLHVIVGHVGVSGKLQVSPYVGCPCFPPM